MSAEPFPFFGKSIPPGKSMAIDIPIARRYTSTGVTLPVSVSHGKKPGPCVFVCAAIHGDEINGIEIVRRVLDRVKPGVMSGTLIAVPVVNVYGFVAHTRYLPDRRDLNRSFPGSPRGSLAARLAHTFLTEVASKADYGIDLHTGAAHRTNLPQVRASLDAPGCDRLAHSFGTPVIIDAELRPGSLRHAALDLGIPVITYEGGEALRSDEIAIRAGVRGVLSVLRDLDVIPPKKTERRPVEPFVARGTTWIRAPESGVVNTRVKLGAKITRGETLAAISDPLGADTVHVVSKIDGVVIGRSTLPLANEGDALFHVAVFERLDPVADEVDLFHEDLLPTADS